MLAIANNLMRSFQLFDQNITKRRKIHESIPSSPPGRIRNPPLLNKLASKWMVNETKKKKLTMRLD